MTVTMVTFHSCKILAHSIVNCCAGFWHLLSLQNQGTVTQTGLPSLDCISSALPIATCPHLRSPSCFVFF